MKYGKLLMTGIFCGILGIGCLVSILKPDKEFSEKENRFLETRPDIYLDDILSGDFQRSYEDYINDQFFLRDEMVGLSVDLQKLLGKRDINGAYLGSEGYLLERYTDEDFKPELLEDNPQLLAGFLNRMTETYGGEHVVCMLVPGKANVMTDKLPPLAEGYYEEAVIEAVRNELTSPDILLDITSLLQSHQDEYIYYRTDHHWTSLGAYYGYTAWAEHTGRKQRSLSEYTPYEVSRDFYGTTYNKLPLDVEQDIVTIYDSNRDNEIAVNKNDGESVSDSFYFPEEIEEEADKYRIFFGGNTAKIDITTGIEAKGTLLLFKDSFANCFVPFISEDYSRIIMVDLRYYSEELSSLFTQYPDITDVMVLYNVEKFIEDDSAGNFSSLLEEE